MQKQTRSILEELSNISFKKDKENVVESRASHIIESAIRLISFIKENFGIHFNVPLKIDAEVGFSFGDGVEVDFHNGKPQNLNEIKEYLNV